MNLLRRRLLYLAGGAAAISAASQTTEALSYPSRPVRIIVGFAAATGADILARLKGQWLSERLGQQFVIENRPGAGTNIGWPQRRMPMKPGHDAFHPERLRRRADGSVDVEFYRRRAVRLRAEMISSAAVAIWRALTAFGRVVGWPRSFRRTNTRAPCATRFAESDAPDFDISAGQQPATGGGARVGSVVRQSPAPNESETPVVASSNRKRALALSRNKLRL